MFLVAVTVYLILDRTSLSSVQAAAGLPATTWDLLLKQAGDTRLVTFVVLPAWLLYAVARLETDLQPLRLIRAGSYRALLAGTLCRSITVMVVVGGCVLGIALLTSIGVPPSWAWSELAVARPVSPLEGLPYLQAGWHPLPALLVQVALTLLALLAAQVLLVVTQVLTKAQWPAVALATLIWLWAVTSTSGLTATVKLLNIGYYLDAKSSVGTSTLPLVAGILCVIVVLGFASLAARDRQFLLPPRWWASPLIVYTTVSLALIGFVTASSSWDDPASAIGVNSPETSAAGMAAPGGRHSVSDVILGSFTGRNGTFVDYLVSAFLFVGYAYCFMIRRARVSAEAPVLELIRHGSYTRWVNRLLVRELPLLPALLLLFLIAANLTALVVSGPPRLTAADMPVLIAFLVGGTLQLLLHIVLVLGAALIAGTESAGLIAAALLVVLGSPFINPTSWWPFGADAMSVADTQWPTIPGPLLISVLTVAAAYAGLRIMLTHRTSAARLGRKP